ncbi:hypothetical protein DFH07DRAFT_1005776 [Mycena maculata]|uniref:ZZ-type domain-containing protein n=1 Tax=Mycena maculata TaxID=230809 RepID=A0AAD7JSN3_9AGAR|nr:hypothetical protein DFH07DRAFT_1005776 [Mycena maculata]
MAALAVLLLPRPVFAPAHEDESETSHSSAPSQSLIPRVTMPPGSSGNTLALQVDTEGNVRYDAIAHQGQRDDKIIQSQRRCGRSRAAAEERVRHLLELFQHYEGTAPPSRLYQALEGVRLYSPRRYTCDGCKKAIYSIRYKYMHPECPDFDLCDSCEAFPIPVLPDNHSLLKMRSANTVMPTGALSGPDPEHPFAFSVRPDSCSPVLVALLLQFDPLPLLPMMMLGGLYDSPAFARQLQPARPVFPVYDGQYSHSHEQYPAYENPLFATPQPTASRFSHSPSPSPPLFRDHSRSPSPPRTMRPAMWETLRWNNFEEAQQVRWGAAAVPPVPIPAVAEPAFPSFWPKSSDELRHLMQNDREHEHEAPVVDTFSRLSVQQEEAAVMDSSLTGEALLRRVEMMQANMAPVTSSNLAVLLSRSCRRACRLLPSFLALVLALITVERRSALTLLVGAFLAPVLLPIIAITVSLATLLVVIPILWRVPLASFLLRPIRSPHASLAPPHQLSTAGISTQLLAVSSIEATAVPLPAIPLLLAARHAAAPCRPTPLFLAVRQPAAR